MAASSSNLKSYDVFLSFRGTDIRDGFRGHLCAALDGEGIYTFVDSEELRKGEPISPALMKAIEESHAAIIVFSEHYASSTWCLEELATIMECNLRVFPVFYKVEPKEVRTPRASYRKAMAEHESRFGEHSAKVKRWAKALFDAGSLSGWEYHKGDEAEFIQLIVKELSIHLERPPLHVAEHPVGIGSRVEELISLSQKEWGDDDVLMIGLWGPGGVGKTTLAKAMYNAIERQFQGSSFLERVRETSNQSNGPVTLQARLLSEILPHSNLKVHSVDRGITLIQQRLRCKKVLLVIDDVDKLDQLKVLAGEGHWFGKGSRIIITSRDKHLLTSHGINCVYEVKTLDDDEAQELFRWYAFRNGMKVEIRRDLIDRAVHYANGLPLALKVLGPLLYGRKELVWESTLRKLSKIPDEAINQVLKTSFEGLEPNEREIFLDIACFFKGKYIEYIKKVLDSCGFESTVGIEVLIERSLITNEHGTLQMHDLIQLMGKEIVHQECPDDLRMRSRLWVFEDVEEILSEDEVMDAIKAIVLDSPKAEEITISSPHAFTNMRKLRILILSGVHISSEGPVCLPNELRWLEWSNAPELEFGSRPKLVGIEVSYSRSKQLVGSFTNFRMLKFINFHACKLVTSVPDLSSAPNLESLDFSGCENLIKVHQSVGCLGKLTSLNLGFCSNLSIFPSKLETKSLRTLGFFGCSKLDKFPDILEKNEHLGRLDLRRTAIEELPTSIENLVSVKEMSLEGCKKLARLPSSIYKLHNLEFINLGGCSNLVMFPKNLEDSTDPDGQLGFPNLDRLHLQGCSLSKADFLESSSSFPKLKTLYLSENKFTHLPTSINKYDGLESLHMDGCQQLQEIPQLPSNMHTLRAGGCRSLHKLPDWSSLPSNDLDVYLFFCRELFPNGVKMADVSLLEGLRKMKKAHIVLIGGEMPEWIFHCDDDRSIYFMVPQDLYDKPFVLALCVVLVPEDGQFASAECELQYFSNGEWRTWILFSFNTGTSANVSLQSFRLRWRIDNYLQNGWARFRVCLRPCKAILKKCGLRLICEQPDDDVRVVFQHHQPIDETNWIPKESDSEESDSEEANRIAEESDSEESDSEEANWILEEEANQIPEESDSEEANWILEEEANQIPEESDSEEANRIPEEEANWIPEESDSEQSDSEELNTRRGRGNSSNIEEIVLPTPGVWFAYPQVDYEYFGPRST